MACPPEGARVPGALGLMLGERCTVTRKEGTILDAFDLSGNSHIQ